MKTSRRILVFVALAIAGVFVLGVTFVYSGVYHVGATTGHTRPVAQLLRIFMMRSVVRHARGIVPPASFDAKDRALAEHAADHYEMMCRTCHGAPGKKPDPWQLYPPPPDLADAVRVTGWTDAEIFWIIKHGIKDTGMSGFGLSHADEELWALTGFVRQLPSISAEQYHAMTGELATKAGPGHEGKGHAAEPAAPHKH